MVPEQQRLSTAERSNLVAYLDGQLSEDEARAIATKLTHSPSARYEADALERTWELLDYLSRPRASQELATRTLSMARQLDERGGQIVSAASLAFRRLAQVLITAATVVAILALGYATTRWAWPDPTARLARDLSIAEHLDEYQDVGSFEFLQQLDISTAFPEDAP